MKRALFFPIAVAVVTAIAYVASTYWYASELPAHVATHFDLNGHANGWMTKQEFINFSLVAGLGTQLFVTAVMWVGRFLPPKMMNLPNRDYWHKPENFPEACDRLLGLSLWLGTLLVLWVGLLNYQIVEANRLKPSRLDTSSFMFAMGTFVIMLAAWMIFMWKEFRLPEGSRKKASR